jgi:hypothetical protein
MFDECQHERNRKGWKTRKKLDGVLEIMKN